MASRKAALMALLVATLLSSLMVQGALDRREEDFHCCYCDCLNNKRCTLMKGIAQLQCQWFCFNIKCAFKCNDTRYNRCMHDLGSRGVGVPFAAGGGALDKGNGTETGADAAPSL